MPEPKTEIDDSNSAIGYSCFRCNQAGHGWTECDRPPARTRQEYERRITELLIRWDAGKGFRTSIRKRIVEIERNAFRKARNAS